MIGRLVEVSMNDAVDQVKALPGYDTNGEVSVQEVSKSLPFLCVLYYVVGHNGCQA